MSTTALPIANDYRGRVPATNYNPGRAGHRLIHITAHYTACHEGAATARFLTVGAQVSAHEQIRRDGLIDVYLDEENTSFADGVYEDNLDTYSIETEHDPTDPNFTDAQYLTWHFRVAELRAKYGPIPIYPHNYFVPTICPNGLDLTRLEGGFSVGDSESIAEILAATTQSDSLFRLMRRVANTDPERITLFDVLTAMTQMENRLTAAIKAIPAGPQGAQGVQGIPGDAAVIPPGTTLKIT